MEYDNSSGHKALSLIAGIVIVLISGFMLFDAKHKDEESVLAAIFTLGLGIFFIYRAVKD